MFDSTHMTYSDERAFQQAVEQHFKSIAPVLRQNSTYLNKAIFERLVEPERMVTFRVPWADDRGQVKVNRGYRVEMNSALGPYKGGVRFHPSITPGILKALAFDQVFANALSGMSLGGASGGSDFDPKGKSDSEVMRFCQNFMAELFRHIGPDTDIPSGDMGVGMREIGYLFGMYKRLANEFSCSLTGKGLGWGGSLMRPQAAGYGCVYFSAAMLSTRKQSLAGKACLVSGSGKMAMAIAEKLIQLGAKVLTMSDSEGHIYDPAGIDLEKLEYLKELKFIQLGRIKLYAERYPSSTYIGNDADDVANPLWSHWADCAFPAAVENEINQTDAYNLINQNIKVVCEGAHMPCKAEAIKVFQSRKDILYAPAKASGAGGSVAAGFEMAQNNMRLSWTRNELDQRLKQVMQNIHLSCLDAAQLHGDRGNYVVGANIAAFSRVANAVFDQGLV